MTHPGCMPGQVELEKEIMETLKAWKGMLARTELIFLRVTGPRASFFGGKEPALSRHDPSVPHTYPVHTCLPYLDRAPGVPDLAGFRAAAT